LIASWMARVSLLAAFERLKWQPEMQRNAIVMIEKIDFIVVCF